jgi:ATP-binding cassette, subfamily B, multidrug efflux pump
MAGDAFESDAIAGKIYDGPLVRRLLGAIGPHRRLVYFALLLLTVSTAVDLILPYLTKVGIDRYLARLYNVYEAPAAVCEDLLATDPAGKRFMPAGPGILLVRKGSPQELSLSTRTLFRKEGRLSPETYYVFPREARPGQSRRGSGPGTEANAGANANPGADVGRVAGPYWLVPEGSLRHIPPAVILQVRGADVAGIIRLAWITAALILVGLGAGYGHMLTLQIAGQRSMFDLRTRLFRHIQGLSLEYFDKNPVGRLVTRVTNDIEALNDFFAAVLLTLIKDSLLLIGTLAILFWLDWKLALIAATVLPLLILVSVGFRVRFRGAFREVRRLLAQLNADLSENLSGIKVIQVFRREKARFDRFQKVNTDYFRANMRQLVLFGIFRPAVELISAIGVALVLIYGGAAVLKDALTLGALVAFLSYVRQMFRPIVDMSEKYNILQSAMASAERVFGVLDTEPKIVDGPTADRAGGEEIVRPEAGEGVAEIEGTLTGACEGRVDFEHVRFSYSDDKPVLNDISFTVMPGRSVALVGPTGAGKTSVISLLCRFYDPVDGRILLNGVDLRSLPLATLRENVALVLQDSFIFSRSIEENIRLGAPMDDARVRKVAGMVQADGFIERLSNGYGEIMAERGATLSTGQKQLLCFARALARDPRVLILDEATSSVDPATEKLIQGAIETLMRGRTSIIVAHRLSTIQKVDEILVIDDGRIVERGSHQELLARRGIYYNLYLLQYREG